MPLSDQTVCVLAKKFINNKSVANGSQKKLQQKKKFSQKLQQKQYKKLLKKTQQTQFKALSIVIVFLQLGVLLTAFFF